jgi:hypothetical protein
VSSGGAHRHGAEGFCTVRKYRFRALVALDPWARPNSLLPFLDGTGTQYVVQPRDGKYFPVRISIGATPPSPGRPVDVVVRVPLLAGEAEAFFAAGQPFTVWADAVVDDETIRGEGLLGDGVIFSHESAALPNASARAASLGAPAARCSATPPCTDGGPHPVGDARG